MHGNGLFKIHISRSLRIQIDRGLRARTCRKDERIEKGNKFRNDPRHGSVFVLFVKQLSEGLSCSTGKGSVYRSVIVVNTWKVKGP